ncbi:hypothetical protein Bca52824_007158 [Brassica carinata]|uniref:Uncharacterized protein n=1 Tax=Brassica carinata TaxID=52824 RepID=A0A8X8B6Q6_BRACI|nr:hypothetical protein Bca52824_007158 [Brassica carinata]
MPRRPRSLLSKVALIRSIINTLRTSSVDETVHPSVTHPSASYIYSSRARLEEEAIEATESLKVRCSDQAYIGIALDSILLDLYKFLLNRFVLLFTEMWEIRLPDCTVKTRTPLDT